MVKIANKADCVGCTACESVCPTGAIKLRTDAEGFYYPVTATEKCIDCGLCDKTCPVGQVWETEEQPKAYAVIAKEENILEESSSGGVFFYLAKEVINRGGIVYGAALTEDIKVAHIGIENPQDILRIMGSKYVQSDLSGIFAEIKANLKAGRMVLFAGTPCQVAGLQLYLGSNRERLITVALICHGVPSPKVFDKYICSLENKYGKKVCDVKFRSKKVSWRRFSFVAKFDDGFELTEEFVNNTYLKGFINNLFLRPSCHRCRFKTANHNSDITLGDFWGIGNVAPTIDSEKGVSLCCVNSKKGAEIFEAILDHVKSEEVAFAQAVKYNSAYAESALQNRMRKWFFEHLDKTPVEKNIEKSLSPSLVIRLVLKLKKRKYRAESWN